jgi:hypothetical protein
MEKASEYRDRLGGPGWEIPELLRKLVADGKGFTGE